MEALRSWALSVCFVCVIGSIFSMIFTDNSSKKLLNLIISLMILCVIFKPAASIGEFMLRLNESSFNVSEYENTQLNNEIADNAESIYSSYLSENLRRVLNENNISYENITISMDSSEDYCISIGQVEVIVKNEDVNQSENIKKLLRNYTGTDVRIIVSTEQ